MATLYQHYSLYHGPWPWKNFTPKEVSCRHCGELYLDLTAMDCLQALRDLWAKPIRINSGHRCRVHNQRVGGVPGSKHLQIAFDCAIPKEEQGKFICAAKEAGFTGIGIYPGRGFVHLDKGPEREWQG